MIGLETARVWLAAGTEILAQSSVILVFALLASSMLRRRGPAAQVLVLRTSLVAVVACAAICMALPGKVPSLLRISLPATALTPGPSPAEVGGGAEALSSSSYSPGSDSQEAAFLVSTGLVSQEQVPARPPSGGLAGTNFVPPARTPPAFVVGTPQRTRLGSLMWMYRAGIWIWAGGVLALLSWLTACQVNLILIRRRCVRVGAGPLFDSLVRLSTQLAVNRPALYEGPSVKSPFLAGLARPSIFLPADFTVRFDGDARVAVLAHELCHLRRRDSWWALLARSACVVLWLQPLIWLLGRWLVDCAEAACDADVVALGLVAPSAYAGCLVDMAEFLAMPRATRSVALGVVPFRSALGRRVERILSGAGSLIRPITLALRVSVALGGVAVAIAGVFLISAHGASHAATAQTPTAAVREYIDDLSDGQVASAKSLLSPRSQHIRPAEISLITPAVDLGGAIPSPREASLLAVVALFGPKPAMGYRFEVVGPSNDNSNVVILKVYPPGITLRNSFELGVATVSTENGAPRMDIHKTLALIDPQLPKDWDTKSAEMACASNLRQLALATLRYLQDNNERFPDASHWVDEVMPYLPAQAFLRDPLYPKRSWGFAFNRNLSGKALAEVEAPADTTMFFESMADRKNAADTGQSMLHSDQGAGKVIFACVDGRVRWLRDNLQPSFSIRSERAVGKPIPEGVESGGGIATANAIVTWKFSPKSAAARTQPALAAPQSQKAIANESVEHLQKLAHAALEYALNNDGRLPGANRWMDELEILTPSDSIFHDPLAPAGTKWGYAYNRNLSGVKLASLKAPAETVLFYESELDEKNAADIGQSSPASGRISGGSYYAFARGFVNWMKVVEHPSFALNPDQPVVFHFPGGTYLGITYVPAAGIKQHLPAMGFPVEIAKTGVIVVAVSPGSPAAAAGLEHGELILQADGQSLGDDAGRFRQLIARHKPGDRMSLLVYSHGQERHVVATLAKPPNQSTQTVIPDDGPRTIVLRDTPIDSGIAGAQITILRLDQNMQPVVDRVAKAVNAARLQVQHITVGGPIAPDAKPLSSLGQNGPYHAGENVDLVVDERGANYGVTITVATPPSAKADNGATTADTNDGPAESSAIDRRNADKRVARDLAQAHFYQAVARYDAATPAVHALVIQAILRANIVAAAYTISGSVSAGAQPLSSLSPQNHYIPGDRLHYFVLESGIRFGITIVVGQAPAKLPKPQASRVPIGAYWQYLYGQPASTSEGMKLTWDNGREISVRLRPVAREPGMAPEIWPQN